MHDKLALIYESSLYIPNIRLDVIQTVISLIRENDDRYNYYINNVVSEKEYNYIVKEGWGGKLAAGLSLILGLIIGQVAPTSGPALSARNEIVKMLEGGLSVNQSWALINKSLSDKYAVTNLDWIKPYINNFNLQDANHQKLIKLIGNTITQDNSLVKPVNQMSDQDRTISIQNSNKLRSIVLSELGIKQDGTVMSLDELANALKQVEQQARMQ